MGFKEWWDNHKIFTWYNNLENNNVKAIIGTLSAMLFGYLFINLFDLIVNGEANW